MKSILYLTFLLAQSIYGIHFNTTDGNDMTLQPYHGKKILIVNIATGSEKVSQIGELQQLYNQYQNQLIVIAFPSNSFGNETRSDAEISHICDSMYHITFPLAAKASVTSSDLQPIYNWLSYQNENGIMDQLVIGDFQKFLVSEDGTLIGTFSPMVSPLDSTITSNLSN